MEDEETLATRLRERIRNEATYHAAPPELVARILASLPPLMPTSSAARPAPRRRMWWIATSLATAFGVMLFTGIQLLTPGAEDLVAQEVVAEHVRSMMVDHAFDVASSDRHTVKPWFAGKLDYSPPVLDLTAQGFSLVGGRLDYIGQRPVSALVYRHRQHLINLFVWPASAQSPAVAPAALRTDTRELQGFHLLRWQHAGMVFWAVSDLNPEELAKFREVLLTAPG